MSTATTIDTVGVFYEAIALDTLAPSKTNPRKHFDEAELQELANSIKDKGVIQPIVIRPKTGGKPQWEIVAGERRWRASKLAGATSIPAIARNLDDKAVLEIQVIENLQRSDIHPLEEANGYRELLDKHGYTIETIAAKVGKSESYIYQRLKLAELIKPVQTLFLENIITAGHAILIARLTPEEQKEVIDDDDGLLWSDNWRHPKDPHPVSVRGLSLEIKEHLYLDLAKAPWKTNDTKLLPAAGSCEACPKRTGANPSLFAEIPEKNICTDRKCYNQKLDAFMARSLEEGGLLKISEVHPPTKADGVIAYNQYREVYGKDDRCKFTQKAISIDGHFRGRTKDICAEKTCTRHHASSSSSGGDDYYAQERKRQLANKITRAKIVAIMKAFHNSRSDTSKSSAPIDGMFEETVRKMWDWAPMYDRTAVALALGLEKKKTKQGGYEHDSYDPAFTAYLKEHHSHSDLIGLVMLIVASRCYEAPNIEWIHTWAKHGENLGKGYHIKNVEAGVDEKLKPKKKKLQTSAKKAKAK